jgi:hypothetical protein
VQCGLCLPVACCGLYMPMAPAAVVWHTYCCSVVRLCWKTNSQTFSPTRTCACAAAAAAAATPPSPTHLPHQLLLLLLLHHISNGQPQRQSHQLAACRNVLQAQQQQCAILEQSDAALHGVWVLPVHLPG